jgi:hypothetical protein
VVQLGAIAEYVDKKPGDTLVDQPTKFDLVDFMIAKALGLHQPPETLPGFAASGWFALVAPPGHSGLDRDEGQRRLAESSRSIIPC